MLQAAEVEAERRGLLGAGFALPKSVHERKAEEARGLGSGPFAWLLLDRACCLIMLLAMVQVIVVPAMVWLFGTSLQELQGGVTGGGHGGGVSVTKEGEVKEGGFGFGVFLSLG